MRQIIFFSLLPWTLTLGVTPDRLDQQARAYLQLEQFNGAVLVAQAGTPLLAKGYGKANFEWDIPAAPDTRFRLGSITKQFTAMAVLLLEQDGKLTVEDPVSRHWPEAPAAWRAITIHQLLTHTSGIFNFTALPDYTKNMRQTLTPAEIVQRVAGKPLEFEPGSQMKYSNTGYVLLGLIIEKTAGMPYAGFVRQRIFEPLGMHDSGYDSDTALIPKRAAGYERRPGALLNAQFLDMSQPHAAGALYSTCLDLWKWDTALRQQKLLSAENHKRYFTPVRNNYSYGWVVAERNGVLMQSHGGGINGFATMIIRVPSKELLVVTLSNVLPSQAGKLAQDLARLALGEEVAVPAPRKKIQLSRDALLRFAGSYELRPGFVLTVTLEGDQLITQATGQPKIPIYAETETRFFPNVIDATIEFEIGASGAVTGLVLEQGGARLRGLRK